MIGIRYILRLEEPVLANSLAGDINSARSLYYIPGGLVRGALIREYLSSTNRRQIDAADDDFGRLFLNGDTRFLHAYPLPAHNRTLPAPFSWKIAKDDVEGDEKVPVDFYNFAGKDERDIEPLLEKRKLRLDDLENIGCMYFWLSDKTIYSREVEFHYNLHTQREAMKGRATEAEGAVFRYEALSPGLRVEGIILTKVDNDRKRLKDLMQQDTSLWFGKSRTAGYGRVVIEHVEDLLADWREAREWPFEEKEESDKSKWKPDDRVSSFVLTFLSPAIVRDVNGHFTNDPRFAIATRLGIDAGLIEQKQIFHKIEIAGGFNRTWGLPLPQSYAIAAGSVFVLQVDSNMNLNWGNLTALEQTGIGERRAEGYGRLMLDLLQPAKLQWQKTKSDFDKPTSKDDIQLEGDAKKVAQIMLRRMLEQELDDKLLDAVRKHSIKGSITNSQISRWRVIIGDARSKQTPPQKLGRLQSFIEREKKEDYKAWQVMEKAYLSGFGYQRPALATWIISLVKGEKNAPWDQLGYGQQIPKITLAGLEQRADVELAAEYTLRLLDGILARWAKDNAKAKAEKGDK